MDLVLDKRSFRFIIKEGLGVRRWRGNGNGMVRFGFLDFFFIKDRSVCLWNGFGHLESGSGRITAQRQRILVWYGVTRWGLGLINHGSAIYRGLSIYLYLYTELEVDVRAKDLTH